MALVQLTPLAITVDEKHILMVTSQFTMTTSSTLVRDFTPTMTVEEETIIEPTMTIYISEEFANLCEVAGLEVFNDAEELEDGDGEDDDEDEEEAPKSRRRGKKVEPEPEPEPEEPVNYWLEYTPSVTLSSTDQMALIETSQWRDKARRHEDKMSMKMSQFIAELNAYHTTNVPVPQVPETADGMTGGANEASAAYMANLASTQQQKLDVHRTNIDTLYAWFNKQILGVKVDDEDDISAVATNAETSSLTMEEVLEYLNEEGAKEFLTKLQRETADLIQYIS